MRSSVRRTVVIAAGLAISGAAVIVMLQTVDFRAAARLLTRADWLLIIAAVLVLSAGMSMRILRWRWLLPELPAGRRVPATRLMRPLLLGYLSNMVLPARLGEGVRAAAVWRREDVGLSEALGSVAVERVMDTAVIAALGAGSAAWLAVHGWLVAGTSLIAVGAAALLGFLLSGVGSRVLQPLHRWPRIAARIDRFIRVAAVPDRRSAGIAVLLTLCAWVLDATMFWLGASSLSISISLPGAMVISAITVLATIIPAAPAYVGTYELAATAAGTAVGLGAEAALALAVLMHAITVVPLVLGGVLAAGVIRLPCGRQGGDIRGLGS